MEPEITFDLLLDVEADTFYCFELFLISLKQNYTSNFEGVYKNLEIIISLIQKMDTHLYEHLKKNQIDLTVFLFRWVFCLLFREFPT